MNGIGKIIYNTKNKLIGRVADVTEDIKQKPNYLILSSDRFSGYGSRYFAVPLTNTFIKITDGGKMVLNVKKDDLREAEGIDFDRSSIIKKGDVLQCIYELMGYHSTVKRSLKKV